MSQPKVSIIVPVYNSEETLTRCINSILNQSFEDFELILVNDGSKDDSLKICKNFEKIDSRVFVINKSNGGVSSARNCGLDQAKGTWVIFVDSDDWIDADYCKTLISAACSPFTFVMTRHDFTDKLVESINECHNLYGEDRLNFILENKILDFSGPYCKLFNREILDKNNIRFPEKIHMGEDGIFFVKYLNATNELTVLNKNNYHYQNNNQSLSHRFFDFRTEYSCYKIWKEEIEKLFYSKKWNDETEYKKAVWDNRIGDTFIRCILCLSRQKKYSIIKNYYNLESITNNDWEEFFKFYIPSTKQRKILKFVLKFKLLLLDTILTYIDRIVNYKQ